MDPFDRSEWTDFERAVGDVLDRLQPGDLVTYGDVATEAGFPGAARAVGSILRRSDGIFSWWRVVSASGRLLPGHEQEQTERLTAEGVEVRAGKIRG